MTAPGPSSLPRLLRDNPDTVTHLLEALTGEPLVADVVRQYSMPAEAGNTLGVGAGQTVTQRIAVLKGGVTTVPYVYAESAFVPARLPESARLQLERTSDPIGRILAAHGLDHVREETASPGLPGTPRALDAAVTGASDGRVVPRLPIDDRRPPRIRHLRVVLPLRPRCGRAPDAGLTPRPAAPASAGPLASSDAAAQWTQVTRATRADRGLKEEKENMVIVAGSFEIKPEDREEFLAGRLDSMRASRAEPGTSSTP